MLLSILIVSLKSRQEQFKKLHDFLESQIKMHHLENQVEILVFEDDRLYPVGLKRNTLIEAAHGKYICFIDDDDWVDNDYVILIVAALLSHGEDIDCIGMKGKLISKELGDKEFIHSIRYKKYSEDEMYYYRPPNHISVIKREIAVKYKFPIINFGEDFDWAMRVCNSGELKKEVFIDKVLYYYNFNSQTSEAMKGA